MYTPLCVLVFVIVRTNTQTTEAPVNFDSVEEGFELITEDLLRVHSTSTVTYHSLWNRVGFNGHDVDGNRRREIMDDWNEFPPKTIHFIYCLSGPPNCEEETSILKINVDVEMNSLKGNISHWAIQHCSVDIDGNNIQSQTCSFQNTVTAGSVQVVKNNQKYIIKDSGEEYDEAVFLIVAAVYNETVCPCDCVYYEKMEAFKNQTREKKTMEELKEEMGPQLDEMKKNLSVDTSKLSAFVNRKISKDDTRVSAKQIGAVGIVFLVLELSAIIFLDLIGFRQHLNLARENWNGILRRFNLNRNFQV